MSNVTAISTAAAKNDKRSKILVDDLKKLGALEAGGAVAKPKMAMTIVRARIEGVIGDKPEDGAATFKAYLAGRSNAATKSLTAQESAPNEKSIKANVSKNTQLLKAASLISAGIDFSEVLDRCAELRSELISTGNPCKPAFDAFVECARKQIKSPKEQIGDDVITTCSLVAVSNTDEKDNIAKLSEDYKRMWKRAEEEGFADNPHMATILAAIQDALVYEGGTVPAMTEDEKEAEKAVKKLEALGFKVARDVTVN